MKVRHISLRINSFECLLCARHCSRCWLGPLENKTDKDPTLWNTELNDTKATHRSSQESPVWTSY